jgi:dihydroflavonol-4-reductase
MVPDEVVRGGPVLVTGAGGFLGANLVWALCEQGFHCRALVRRPPRGPQWSGLDTRRVQFVQGDVRDPASVQQAVAGVQAVLHAAALTEIIPRPRREAFRVNVEGTWHVCEAARRAGVRRLVFTSSASTIPPGTAERPATGNDRPEGRPTADAPYYASKRQAEEVVRDFAADGLEAIVFCPGYILGPRDARPTTNELLLHAARTPLPFFPPGGMNVIDVREVARAHVRALWLGQPGERYVLAGPYRGYAELATLAREMAGRHRPVHVLPRWLCGPGKLVLALAAGVLPRVPNGLTVPSFHHGFVAYHLCGARADAEFGLSHRPIVQTVYDTLRWFSDTGQATWLRLLPMPAP